MSRRSSLNYFFKVKSSASPQILAMDRTSGKKRRSLSLIKPITPNKIPRKHTESDPNCIETVDLCSDEEKPDETPEPVGENTSDLSQSTVSYELTPKTPQKTPRSATRSSFTSPRSGEKFYSPVKRKAVKKTTPVKRRLIDFFRTPPNDKVKNEVFEQACEGMDDKTIFLLDIINKCIQDDKLKRLLDIESQDLLAECLLVKQPGMRLVCRLFWRQHCWYRLDKLKAIASDKLIGDNDTHLMIISLQEAGLLIGTQSDVPDQSSLKFDDYISLLKTDELKALCKDLKIKMTSKQHAKEALQELSKTKTLDAFFCSGGGKGRSGNSQRILRMLKQKTGPCYRLSDRAYKTLHKLYLLMYLGMDYSIIREKKLELMLLNDKVNRETYPVDKDMELDNASVVFSNSREFLRYFAAHNIYEEFIEETNWNTKSCIVQNTYRLYKDIGNDEMTGYKALPPWLYRFTAAYIYVRILEAGIQELKRHKTNECDQLAVDILTSLISQDTFRQHKKANWFEEKALILHKLLGKVEEAAEVLIEGFNSDLPEHAKDVLRPRARRLSIQKNIKLPDHLRETLAQHAHNDTILECKLPADHVYRQPMDNMQRGKIKFQTRTENLLTIQTAEECCITHYLAIGDFTHGEHWEGRIVSTLFFLLFWDIIYSKPQGLKGVFLTRYQKYPLDLFTGSFYTNRKAVIDERLAYINNCTAEVLVKMITEKWEERPEQEMSGIVRSTGLEELCGVLRALKGPGAAAICRRLVQNYGYTHSGFPDLTLWDVRSDKVKFVEVKTDADKPFVKQLQWMHYLQENGIDTGFCYVGVNTTRSKARARERDSCSSD